MFGNYENTHFNRIINKWQRAVRTEVWPEPKSFPKLDSLSDCARFVKNNFFTKNPDSPIDFEGEYSNKIAYLAVAAFAIAGGTTLYDSVRPSDYPLRLRAVNGLLSAFSFSASFLFNKLSKLRVLPKAPNWNNPVFDKRMEEIWQRKHPKQSLPPYMLILGNSTPEEAEVICFAERHSDLGFQKETADWINKTFKNSTVTFFDKASKYANNDIIAVEAKRKGEFSRNNNRVPFVSADFLTTGWEPFNLLELQSKIFLKRKEIENKIINNLNCIGNAIKKGPINNKSDYAAIDKEINHFYDFLKDLGNYYIPDPQLREQKVEDFKASVQTAYQKYKSSQLTPSQFNFQLHELVESFKKLDPSADWRHFSQQESAELSKSWDKRNDSLADTVRDLKTKFKRVFLIAGSNHLTPYKNIEQVTKELSKHKHIIVIKRKTYEKIYNPTPLSAAQKNLRVFKYL